MTTRVCRDCGKEKDLETGFYKSRTNKDGSAFYRRQCKDCYVSSSGKSRRLRTGKIIRLEDPMAVWATRGFG